MMGQGKDDEHDHLHYHGVDKAEKHLSVSEALELFLSQIRPVKSENVYVTDSNNRVLFTDITSPTNLPRLPRSTRDGYAIKISSALKDLSGSIFKIIGEVRIGVIPKLTLNEGQAAKIATGAFVPRGADAVVMREYGEVQEGYLKVTRQVRIGENILSPGEDLKKGQVLFKAGTRMRPHHIALLSLVGVSQIRVFAKPHVALFSTGDELMNANQKDRKNKRIKKSKAATNDATRPFLSSFVRELGGVTEDLGIARDNYDEIRSRMIRGLEYDALVLSAGSSVGERDYVTRSAESISGLNMVVHGVAMRPSSPTGLAVYRGKPVIFLPGFPTSAIVSFFVFGRPSILKLSGNLSSETPTFKASIEEDFEGKPGITHFLRVRLVFDGEKYRATIVRPTEAQYASWLHEANGIAIIGRDGKTKLARGELVPVWLIGDV